jgi:hypothetical protein
LQPGTTGIFGPQPSQQTLTQNASQGLAPGTSGTSIVPSIASAVGSVVSSLVGAQSTANMTAAQQAAALASQQYWNTPIAGIGLTPTTLAIGGVVGAVILIAVMKSGGKKR